MCVSHSLSSLKVKGSTVSHLPGKSQTRTQAEWPSGKALA
jgi:hypothetical protein